jgi:hypothetical protein
MMLIAGEIGVGDGWLINLDGPYEAVEDEGGALSLSQERRMILPQTISWDPASTSVTADQILAENVDELRHESQPTRTDLGPIAGEGWTGHLFREEIDAANGAYELLSPLAAPGTILNLAVRYIGFDEEEGLQRLIAGVVHDPESREAMNAYIREHSANRVEMAQHGVTIMVPPWRPRKKRFGNLRRRIR